MKKRHWYQRLELIRAYWPLILFVVAAIAFLYTLPGRLASAEKHIEKVGDDVDDLKGWAREIQGYTKAMNQQHAPNQSVHPSRTVTPQEWQDPKDGSWWCCSQFCEANENWRQCE